MRDKKAMSDKLIVHHLNAYFASNHALHDVSLGVAVNQVTAIIGPSGCGKSTLVRCLNRMHEVVPGATVQGRVLLDGEDIYAPAVDPVQVRRAVRYGRAHAFANPVQHEERSSR